MPSQEEGFTRVLSEAMLRVATDLELNRRLGEAAHRKTPCATPGRIMATACWRNMPGG